MTRRDLAQSVDPWGKLLAGGGLLHSSGRLRAPNPVVCENKSPWLTGLWMEPRIIRALFQLRRWLRELENCPRLQSKGSALLRSPFPSRGFCLISAKCMHPSPQYKGTQKASDLLSAIMINTKIDYSRERQLGKETSGYLESLKTCG